MADVRKCEVGATPAPLTLDPETMRSSFVKALFLVEYEATIWRRSEFFHLAFSLTAITNEPLEPGVWQ
jgi:hypothetical protein